MKTKKSNSKSKIKQKSNLNKKQKPNKKLFYIGMIGLAVIIISVILVVLLRENSSAITGLTIKINYYGAVNTPLNLESVCADTYCKKGVQTKILATKPELGMFKANEEIRIKTARKIINALNLQELYQSSAPTPILDNTAKTIKWASAEMKNNFEEDTSCLALVGQNYDSEKELEFGVISYLTYKTCNKYPHSLSAAIKHDFLTMDGKFICSQESSTLFSADQETGEISKFVDC